MNMKKINVLGVSYELWFRDYYGDTMFCENGKGGYCDMAGRKIVICNLSTHPDYHTEPSESIRVYQNEIVRHEIVHAFLYESGLDSSSYSGSEPWARNEEIVDWFAMQGPKIMLAWNEAGV